MTTAAAVCSLVLGLAFSLPGGYGAWYYAPHGEVWIFLGQDILGPAPITVRAVAWSAVGRAD